MGTEMKVDKIIHDNIILKLFLETILTKFGQLRQTIKTAGKDKLKYKMNSNTCPDYEVGPFS